MSSMTFWEKLIHPMTDQPKSDEEEDQLYDAKHQEIYLTHEQEACLKYSGDRTLMVKGYAGAGKSLVLMAIAKKYADAYSHKDKHHKVAVFTFQNTLVSTTKELLEVNDSDDDCIVVDTFDHYINELYDGLIAKGQAPRRRRPFGSDKVAENKRLDNVREALKNHQGKYGKHRFHDLDCRFWLDEFDWMKDMNIWTDDEDEYLNMPRRGRGSKVHMSAADRKVAYQIYLEYCNYLARTGQEDWADRTLYIVRHQDLIPDERKFDHVLVDEAQDLSLAQMNAVIALYRKDMTIAMDMNQRIFGRQWTPKLLGIEATTKKLTKSMRTTKQIDALAESVRSRNDEFLSDDDKSLRAIPEREGKLPVLAHLKDATSERAYVVNTVKRFQKANPNLTIGIIAAKKSQIKIFSDWLTSDDISHEQVSKDSTFSIKKPGVKIASAFGAKGLEFDIVIIPNFAEGYFPYGYHPDDEEQMEQFLIKMRNLVYVSMTRARLRLYITYYGDNGSRFINDMDPELYELYGDKPIIRTPVYSYSSSGQSSSYTGSTAYAGNISQSHTHSGPESSNDDIGLAEFMRQRGIEIIDKRPKGGALWAVGDKSIGKTLSEGFSKYGARWSYCEKGGMATHHMPGWFTKSDK